MTGRRSWFRFRIRDLLTITLVVAIGISATLFYRQRGTVLIKKAEELQAWGIIALEPSQLPTVFEPVVWTPSGGESKDVEIPIFNEQPDSMARGALGDELFVEFQAVLIRHCFLSMPELESNIRELGRIETIYISPLSGLDQSHADSLRKRFPEAQIAMLDLPVFIPGVDDMP
ncbi:MAG: hypothetical protein AAGI63_12880 [Planctomycetota bacterium]